MMSPSNHQCDMKENDEDSFAQLMNQSNGYNQLDNNSNKMSNMDVVWQALLYCAKSEEYRNDRSVIRDDIETNNSNQMHKQNVLPALEVELFYISVS